MAERIVYEEEARRAIHRGVNELATAVRETLGPNGRNVVLDRDFPPANSSVSPRARAGAESFRLHSGFDALAVPAPG